MALQSSGLIRLSQIQTEFGGSGAVSNRNSGGNGGSAGNAGGAAISGTSTSLTNNGTIYGSTV